MGSPRVCYLRRLRHSSPVGGQVILRGGEVTRTRKRGRHDGGRRDRLGQRDRLMSARRYIAGCVMRQHCLLEMQPSNGTNGEQTSKLEVIVAKRRSLVGQLAPPEFRPLQSPEDSQSYYVSYGTFFLRGCGVLAELLRTFITYEYSVCILNRRR